MKNTCKTLLLASVASIVTMMPAAHAETTVVKETTVTQTPAVAPAMVVKKETVVTTPTTTTTVTAPVTVTTPVVTTTTVPVTTSSTVVTQTSTSEHFIMPSDRVVRFVDFDLNHDRLLTLNEIGEVLFKVFDTDNNNIIDSNEYEHKGVLTIMPAEKETITTYDFNNDGIADQTQYTYENVLKDTQLARFDANRNGLSAHEFTGNAFNIVDVNKDHQIDLKEWQGTYNSYIDQQNRRDARINK